MLRLFGAVLTGLLVLGQGVSQARELPDVIRDGVSHAPSILEAQANERIAESTLAQTKAAKLPTVRGALRQPTIQTDGSNRDFTPSLQANWTIYDFGVRDAQIERDETNVRYFDLKIDETIEELAYKLGSDYLEALRAKTSLAVAQENLRRHDKIVRQLGIILEYDPGRRSEYTQATARKIQVQETIVSYERALGLALQRLNRYVQPPVTAEELSNPFADLSVGALIERYHVSEEMAKLHPSYRAQQQELERIRRELDALQRSRYPSIDLQAEANKDDAAVYIVLGVDLFDAKKQPGIDEQGYRADAAVARLEQIYDSLKERADIAALQMQEDEARIDITRSQIKALEQVIIDYEDQFKIAARTLLDVVNAYAELASVKQLSAVAQYDLMQGKLDYLAALGALSDWAQLPELSYDNRAFAESGDKMVSESGDGERLSLDVASDEQVVEALKIAPEASDNEAVMALDGQPSSERFVYVNRNGALHLETSDGEVVQTTAVEPELVQAPAPLQIIEPVQPPELTQAPEPTVNQVVKHTELSTQSAKVMTQAIHSYANSLALSPETNQDSSMTTQTRASNALFSQYETH